MSKKVGLLTLHGMGEIDEGYADGLLSELRERIGVARFNANIHTGVITYQEHLQPNEDKVWSDMNIQASLDWKRIRKFFMYSFADPVSLEHGAYKNGSVYKKAQTEILNALHDAYGNLEDDKPIVIVAGSLGGHVMSNYIWDCQNNGFGIWKDSEPDGTPKDSFRRLSTLKRLYTIGCNIPLFVAGHQNIKPIDPPNDDFSWHNYYDEDDVLGWPLQPLSPEYRELVEDHEINAGNILITWNPLAHLGYWTDNDFVEPLADYLESFL